jgi:hypothetical protein
MTSTSFDVELPRKPVSFSDVICSLYIERKIDEMGMYE